MQSIIDDLKRRMDDLAATLQRLVPTARVGAVAYRDRDEGKGTTGLARARTSSSGGPTSRST